MANRQYVCCKFRQNDYRSYTYHWDGETLHEGDNVKVMDASGEGWKRVFVQSTSDRPPPFATKPIIEKLEPISDGTTGTDGAGEGA